MSAVDAVIVVAALYFAVSLLCSGLTEVVATGRGWRHEGLVRGVEGLVDGTTHVSTGRVAAAAAYGNPAVSGTSAGPGPPAATPGQPGTTGTPLTAAAVLAQPVVRNLAVGLSGRRVRRGQSYLSGESFADAVLDSLQDAAPGAVDWREAVRALPGDHPLRRPLLRFAQAGDLDVFRRRLAAWYDESMDRMTGWYARRTRRWVAGCACVLTVSLNADAVALGASLWHQVLNDGTATFPWGWSASVDAGSVSGWLARVAGWVVTVVAVSFGAAFWFDLLSGIVRTRGAGAKPPRAWP